MQQFSHNWGAGRQTLHWLYWLYYRQDLPLDALVPLWQHPVIMSESRNQFSLNAVNVKRPVLKGIASLAIALGAFAQGSINLDNSIGVNYGLAIDSPGNYYTGTFGLEVWELSGAVAVPAGINGASWAPDAYNAMGRDGFKLEATFANKFMSSPGTFLLGEVDLPDVTPRGSTVVIALAAWNNSAASWTASVNGFYPNIRFGVIAFLNPTVDYTALPPRLPANLTGWNSVGDLVMGIPEPGTFALAGVGVAALLTFRRRKGAIVGSPLRPHRRAAP